MHERVYELPVKRRLELDLPSDVNLYRGQDARGLEGLVDLYPKLTWATSLLGRVRLWEYLHRYGGEESRAELEDAHRLLRRAADAGDPHAAVACSRVLGILDVEPDKRIALVDDATRSLTDTLGIEPIRAAGALVRWTVPKDQDLSRRVAPWCPEEPSDAELHGLAVTFRSAAA